LQKLSWRSVKRTFKGWQLYIFTISYAFWSWATNSNTWIILFLVRSLFVSRRLVLTEQKDVKNPDGSLRFSVSEINAIPIGGYALQLIAMLLFAWLSSRTGKRATWIVVQMVSICP
jgi:ACS family pantothenate transporter-like MFS transporter